MIIYDYTWLYIYIYIYIYIFLPARRIVPKPSGLPSIRPKEREGGRATDFIGTLTFTGWSFIGTIRLWANSYQERQTGWSLTRSIEVTE